MTEDYSRAEHRLHTVSKSSISQVILPQVFFLFFFKSIYIKRALNTGTCIQQGEKFYSAGLHKNNVLATANTGKTGERFGEKMQVNGLEG